MDLSLFKNAMARVTGPVAVITSYEDDAPYGTTVSSLASLSLRPAMISVALDNASSLLDIVQRTQTFGINILSVDQHESAARFSGPREHRFTGTAWDLHGGLPRLAGTSAWLECTVAADFVCGDHTLIIGYVTHCSVEEHAPLAYSMRTYGSIDIHPSAIELSS
ncbi:MULTISPECIES: flavin reductase family protein [Rhodococcus]|jgi:flavin reductase (DIM6/NTAB) family NADH-FMN oxidoreductase RutF|uniref:Flavin reductase family protein n=1 Tax=Rhodococcus oxybenzonivorans TaxID=1990687 RepID=A0AAE5A481_9NOCA|nr:MULTISPECIES: flavin reductase family protein [Rhodococcus]MDV7244330.1 flavin reductase family protein [Rhodococcus oxybenzonivorans]MDV7263510.1 flavin reductase family protein [Rhodococcus oxybenzonivorans]MDV7274427.1 flavin reductase family protein [Rhodococcus oxybenzonivorans]MDV7345377.1 flavin reductase family protein [Rhodococcus oxybenzonivorans]MDV8029064.1 flavin reductase family protein [Rhodococcus sp. IEGM 27]